MSHSLQPHGLQHTRLPCPPLSPGFCLNSCPSSQWYYPTSYPLPPSSPFAFNLPQHQALFQWVVSSHRCPKFWSFSFSVSPSNEYLGSSSFRVDWFDILAVRGTLKSLLQHHVWKHQIFSAQHSFRPTVTPVHDYWKKQSWLCRPFLTKWCLGL